MLGKTIRDLRKGKGWTQADLARIIGVTQQAISHAEKTGDAGRDVLVGVARAFGISVDQLLGAAPPTNELDALIDELEQLGAAPLTVASYRHMGDQLTQPESREALLIALRSYRNGLQAQRPRVKPQRKEQPAESDAISERDEPADRGRISARGRLGRAAV